MVERRLAKFARRQLKRDLANVRAEEHGRWLITQQLEFIHPLRVLQGRLCSGCDNFRVDPKNKRRDSVIVRCKVGNNPLTLYESTPYKQEPKCIDYVQQRPRIRKSKRSKK